MRSNTKYIFPSDDRREIVDKINYNFYQLYFNSVGEEGPIGPQGATGLIGQVGNPGNLGPTGERATNWYFQTFPPTGASVEDFWVDTGLTGGRIVYEFNGFSWVNTGETLLSDSIFSLVNSIQGPGSSVDHNAVVISYTTPQTPGNYTVVLSDDIGNVNTINPTLAKLLISTDASQFVRPLLSFGKDFIPSQNLPQYTWTSVGGGYEAEFATPNNLTYSSGGNSEYSATGGTASIISQLTTTITAPTVSIIGATGASGAFSISSPSSLNFISSRTAITPSSFSLLGFTSTSSTTHNSANSISLRSNNGVISNIASGQDSQNILAATNIAGLTGEYYFASRAGGNNVIGNVGLTGSAGVRVNLVKPFSLLTYSVGPTFSRPPFTNSFAEVQISNLYEDVVRVRVRNTDLSAVSADGRSNRFYLQFSTFNQLLTSLGEVRTFDFLLDDLTYAFGGIRVVAPNINTIIPISDTGLGNTQACRHIRVTFMPNLNGFYYNAYSTSNNLCGFASYVLTSEESLSPTE